MAKKNNTKRKLVGLVSEESGVRAYYTKKNTMNTPDKLTLKKYDPVLRKHVVFTETKLRVRLQGRDWRNQHLLLRRPGLCPLDCEILRLYCKPGRIRYSQGEVGKRGQGRGVVSLTVAPVPKRE